MRPWLRALTFIAALSPIAPRAATTDHYALLMGWLPGLCTLEPEGVECKDLTLHRFDGLNLAFMALQSVRESGSVNTFCWPMPSDSEMDRERRWCDMDAL